MTLREAQVLVKDWQENYFPGRVKTNLHKLAELYLKNPIAFCEAKGIPTRANVSRIKRELKKLKKTEPEQQPTNLSFLKF